MTNQRAGAGGRCRRDAMRTALAATLAGMLFVSPLSAARAVEKGFTVFHGDRESPRVAVTVDDCYRADCVREILDLCAEHDVPVTFFVVGSALRMDDAALWQEAVERGCEIGNHTWGHKRLPTLNRAGIRSQLSRTEDKLNAVLGFPYAMRVMRPPYGDLSSKPGLMSEVWVAETIHDAGYARAVRWDVSQTDAKKAIRQVENGSILLYHANPKDVRCLKALLPALAEAGYACVTVSDLLDIDGGGALAEDANALAGGGDALPEDADVYLGMSGLLGAGGLDGGIAPAREGTSASAPCDATRWLMAED